MTTKFRVFVTACLMVGFAVIVMCFVPLPFAHSSADRDMYAMVRMQKSQAESLKMIADELYKIRHIMQTKGY